MNFKVFPWSMSSVERRAALVMLSMLFFADRAMAQRYQDLSLTSCNSQPVKLAAKAGTLAGALVCDSPVSTGCDIKTSNFPGTVFWDVAGSAANCSHAPNTPTVACGNITVTLPDLAAVPQSATTTISNTTTLQMGSGTFSLLVADSIDTSKSCTRSYQFRVTAEGGGWGDPHLTTVDGVHYDFQSAGEFTALKEDKFEVQTRQRPVSTTTPGGVNDYTGLGTCVSLYSAVAARIGSNRVTLQPNLSGQPDPSGLQLRVNGNLVTLTDRGIDLRAGGSSDPKAQLEGRIVMAAGGAYEFDDAAGTQLVATPAYWTSQQTWYLNLNVYQTSAANGIWGRLASGSWLPALPDGTSLGSRPQAPDQRYQDFYGRFADAWRVTDATSLFDYAPGTNTAAFTVANWPRFNPRSCLIQGQTPAEPATPQVAGQACSAITDPAQKADCVFDVTVTGNTGFAQTYETMQRFRPHGTGWQPVLAGVGLPEPTPQPKSPWWWWILILILVLVLIAVLIARSKKTA